MKQNKKRKIKKQNTNKNKQNPKHWEEIRGEEKAGQSEITLSQKLFCRPTVSRG